LKSQERGLAQSMQGVRSVDRRELVCVVK